jgi:protein-S-isoprenylcysteine O-methyltransferase Ste14
MDLSQYAILILIPGWIVWLAPFLLFPRSPHRPSRVDRRARWGMLLEALAFAMVWWPSRTALPPSAWQYVVSVGCVGLACGFSWTAVRALGPHWRVDAGLDPNHHLVQSGPYRFVRHPIYSSLLFLLLGTGMLVASPLLLSISMGIFLAGTVIRVRVEDGLLASQFGAEFDAYRAKVPAIIPFFR